MSTPPASPTPARERRYEIGAPVGHGASGEVFRAWDHRLQRHVALKRLTPPQSDAPASDRETAREATHLAAAQHPNIVTVHDLAEDEEGPFMIMELLEGETLDSVVRRGAFPLPDFLDLARQTLEGLSAAHEVGLLHCDLKPANIMLRKGATDFLQVKLLDFGIASFSAEKNQPSSPKVAADGSVTVLGTVEFMAPEQFEHAAMTPQADLYSVGCIFHYALTGRDPFEGKTMSEIMQSHLAHRVTPIEELRPDLPPALCAWISRLIRRLPEDRPASAAQALSELKVAVQGAATLPG